MLQKFSQPKDKTRGWRHFSGALTWRGRQQWNSSNYKFVHCRRNYKRRAIRGSGWHRTGTSKGGRADKSITVGAEKRNTLPGSSVGKALDAHQVRIWPQPCFGGDKKAQTSRHVIQRRVTQVSTGCGWKKVRQRAQQNHNSLGLRQKQHKWATLNNTGRGPNK